MNVLKREVEPRTREKVFPSMVRAILPKGGFVAVLFNVYFDESGTHRGSPIMTMASYIFDDRQARLFSRDWQKALDSLGLDFAHMTDCALGFGEYQDLSPRERDKSARLLIKSIRKRSLVGFSISVNPTTFNGVMGDLPFNFSAYTLLLLISVMKIRDFVKKTDPDRQIAFFFEAGHEKANEANTFMNAIPQFGWEEQFLYAGHSFVNKRAALPLQAADMLAWQHRHYIIRKQEGHETPRKDFVALARDNDLFSEIDRSQILNLRALFDASMDSKKAHPLAWMKLVSELLR